MTGAPFTVSTTDIDQYVNGDPQLWLASRLQPREPNDVMQLGIEVHRLMEDYHVFGVKPPPDTEAGRIVLDYLADPAAILVDFDWTKEVEHHCIPAVQIAVIDGRLKWWLDIEPGYRLASVCDLVRIEPEKNRLTAIDWKSGFNRDEAGWGSQGSLYAWRLWKQYPTYAEYAFRPVMLRFPREDHTRVYTPADLAGVEEWLRETVREMRIVLAGEVQPARRPNRKCGDCPVRATCSEYQSALVPVEAAQAGAAMTLREEVAHYEHVKMLAKLVEGAEKEVSARMKERLSGGPLTACGLTYNLTKPITTWESTEAWLDRTSPGWRETFAAERQKASEYQRITKKLAKGPDTISAELDTPCLVSDCKSPVAPEASGTGAPHCQVAQQDGGLAEASEPAMQAVPEGAPKGLPAERPALTRRGVGPNPTLATTTGIEEADDDRGAREATGVPAENLPVLSGDDGGARAGMRGGEGDRPAGDDTTTERDSASSQPGALDAGGNASLGSNTCAARGYHVLSFASGEGTCTACGTVTRECMIAPPAPPARKRRPCRVEGCQFPRRHAHKPGVFLPAGWVREKDAEPCAWLEVADPATGETVPM